ncbi:MAG: signal peptidase II [Solirubrobacteraceae bacterium]
MTLGIGIMAAALGVTVLADLVTKSLILSRRFAGAAALPALGIMDAADPAGSGRRILQPRLNVRAPICRAPRALLIGVWMLSLFAVSFLLLDSRTPGMSEVGWGWALGGSAANLIDRLRRGGILDFVAIGPWPPFNLADAAIVAGLSAVGVSAL